MIIHFTTGAANDIALDAPTRTRTRDSSLGPRRDRPLHHQGNQSGRQGIRTLIPRRETALAVRPGQPYPATFQSSRSDRRVDHRGVEPRSPGCKPGVVPLDQQPMSVEHRQRSARESNSVPLLTRKGCRRRTRGPSCFIQNLIESSRRESNPRFLFVREVSSPLDHGTVRVARVGVEPTDHQGLSWAALPVCVSCRPFTHSAPPMGFEPMVSTLTGWRALQAAPRGHLDGD